MVKVLSYNVSLETNLSYAQTFRRVIRHTPKTEWIYGSYDYNGQPVKRDNYLMVPGALQPDGLPAAIHQTVEKLKPDLVFMHEDSQRTRWLEGVKSVPSCYWMPWDNEDRDMFPLLRDLRKIDVPIAVAKFAQDLIQQNGVDCLQIYNPVDTNVYTPNNEARKSFRERLGLKDDDTLLTWVGRAGWRKRVWHLIEVLRRIRKTNDKVHLLLHTDFNDPQQNWRFEELLHQYDFLKGNAVLHPSDLNFAIGYPETEMNAIYNATDIYVSAQGGEGMNIPICEAMAAGKPFVCTDYTTTQEFANYPDRGKTMIGTRGCGAKIDLLFKDKGILRPYVDIQNFTDQTNFLINNPDICLQMGKEGRKFILKEASCEVVGYKLQRVFDNITSTNIVDCV